MIGCTASYWVIERLALATRLARDEFHLAAIVQDLKTLADPSLMKVAGVTAGRSSAWKVYDSGAAIDAYQSPFGTKKGGGRPTRSDFSRNRATLARGDKLEDLNLFAAPLGLPETEWTELEL